MFALMICLDNAQVGLDFLIPVHLFYEHIFIAS